MSEIITPTPVKGQHQVVIQYDEKTGQVSMAAPDNAMLVFGMLGVAHVIQTSKMTGHTPSSLLLARGMIPKS